MKKEILALAAAGALAFTLAGCSSPDTEKTTTQPDAATEAPQPEATPEIKTPEPKAETPAPVAPSETASQKNAVKKAKSYLDYTAFSYTGLIEQLEYEKFSLEDATYGADNCGANWMVQAEKKAIDYLDYTSFSHDGLVEQLMYEGFTAEEAEHGASSAGL